MKRLMTILIAAAATTAAGFTAIDMNRTGTRADQWGDIPDLVVYADRPAQPTLITCSLPDLLVVAGQTEGTEITFDYADRWGDLPDMIVSVAAPKSMHVAQTGPAERNDES